jgi:hypothetical protein
VHAFTWNEKYTRRFDRARLIYDWVDDLSAFAGRRAALEQQHARLLASAELVLTTARRLWEQAKKSRPDALLCPNGVDFAHFAAARHRGGLPPPDLTPILESGRPIIGYHGALARWFDYELLGAVAARRPDLSFVLVGPDHDRTLAESSLLKQPNLFWLGPKDYQALPAYLAWFEVGIIPFQLNEITHATSPLKLFENLAAGKPVVVTPMQESLDIEGVLAASGAHAFSQKLDEALRLKEDPAYLSLIDRVARENTWEARAEQILSRIMPERKHVKPHINSDSHR